MKNIKVENAKQNVVVAYGPERKQATIRRDRQNRVFLVCVIAEGGERTEFARGESILVGPASEIADPILCKETGKGFHAEPVHKFAGPRATAKPYCKVCENGRAKQIKAEKKAGIYTPKGAAAAKREYIDWTAPRERTQKEMKASLLTRLADTDRPHIARGYSQKYRSSWCSARFTQQAHEAGLTFDQAVALVREFGGEPSADLVEKSWKQHRADFPRRADRDEEAAA